MSKIIIGIHGLANKHPKATDKQWWRNSIQDGLNHIRSRKTFEFETAYWADLMYDKPLDPADPATERYVKPAAGAIKAYKDGWRDAVRRHVLDAAGDAIDRLKGAFGMSLAEEAVLGAKLKDLDKYYDEEEIRDRLGGRGSAKRILRDVLKEKLMEHKDKEIMLIAHSMGSIIAYDVLRELGTPVQQISVARLVTVGSPLGIPLVKHKIIEEWGADGPRTPTVVVNSWVNYSDRKDPVAVDTHLGDDYGPNARGVAVKDDIVLNDYPESSGGKNHHKIYGYLRTPEMARHIAEFLET